MSASAARYVRGAAPEQAPVTRPRLAIVRAPVRGRVSVSIVTVMIVGLLVAMGMVFGLNTAMVATSYKIRDQKRVLIGLELDQQVLRHEVLSLRSPKSVEKMARDMGMVPAVGQSFVDLKNNVVIPATGGTK